MGCSTESTGDGEEQTRKEGMVRRRVEWKKEKAGECWSGKKKGRKMKAKGGRMYKRERWGGR